MKKLFAGVLGCGKHVGRDYPERHDVVTVDEDSNVCLSLDCYTNPEYGRIEIGVTVGLEAFFLRG